MQAIFNMLSVVNSGRKIILNDEACVLCEGHQSWKDDKACVCCEIESKINSDHTEIYEIYDTEFGSELFKPALAHHSKTRCNRQRVAAEKGNFQKYYGRVCEECGCNLRHTLTQRCEGCFSYDMRFRVNSTKIAKERARYITAGRSFPVLTMKMDRGVRMLAKTLGEKTYKGMLCDCGRTNERYTTRGQCVSCVAERNKKPAPAKTGAGDFDHLFE